MPTLPEALDAALRERYPVQGVKTPATQRRGLSARMSQLEKHFTRKGDRKGTAGRRAAAAVGISLRTWERWRKGEQKPTAATLRKLEAAHNQAVVFPKLKRKVNADQIPTKVNVAARVVWNGYRNQVEQRTVKFRSNVRAVMVATIRAWARGTPEDAADTFQRHLSTAEGVPNTDESPGIVFDGNQVEIDFP